MYDFECKPELFYNSLYLLESYYSGLSCIYINRAADPGFYSYVEYISGLLLFQLFSFSLPNAMSLVLPLSLYCTRNVNGTLEQPRRGAVKQFLKFQPSGSVGTERGRAKLMVKNKSPYPYILDMSGWMRYFMHPWLTTTVFKFSPQLL